LNNVLAGEFQPFMMHPKTGLGAKLEFRGRCGGGEMATTRRHYSGESKAKVAWAADWPTEAGIRPGEKAGPAG